MRGWRLALATLGRRDILVVVVHCRMNLTTHVGVGRVGKVPHTGNIREHCTLKSIPLCHNRFLEHKFPERNLHPHAIPRSAVFLHVLHTDGRILLNNLGNTATDKVVLGIHRTTHNWMRNVEIAESNPL